MITRDTMLATDDGYSTETTHTSTSTPPVVLPNHCTGTVKFAGAPPFRLLTGMQDTIMVGGLYEAGHCSCEFCITWTISPLLLKFFAHELKWSATFLAFSYVRLNMNTLRHPSRIMAYIAARAIPPAPITSPVVFEG